MSNLYSNNLKRSCESPESEIPSKRIRKNNSKITTPKVNSIPNNKYDTLLHNSCKFDFVFDNNLSNLIDSTQKSKNQNINSDLTTIKIKISKKKFYFEGSAFYYHSTLNTLINLSQSYQ